MTDPVSVTPETDTDPCACGCGAPARDGVPVADHPHTDPGDGRKECATCGKYVHEVTHSCKGVPVTRAARSRVRAAPVTAADPRTDATRAAAEWLHEKQCGCSNAIPETGFYMQDAASLVEAVNPILFDAGVRAGRQEGRREGIEEAIRRVEQRRSSAASSTWPILVAAYDIALDLLRSLLAASPVTGETHGATDE